MPGLPVPMLRPGGRARPRGGKDGYGCRAGRGTGHGNVESESCQTHEVEEIKSGADREEVTCSLCVFPSK